MASKIAILGVLVALGGMASVAAAGDAPSPSDYTPAQAQALAQTPVDESVNATVTAVQTTAAGLPSGTDPSGVTEGTRPQAGDNNVCWYVGWNGGNELGTKWGSWPYQQKVIEWRKWCAKYYGGPQTYRYSEVHLDSLLCNSSGRYQRKSAGGNGYTYTDVEAGAHFDCPTDVPWVTLHLDRWQIYRCTTRGDCARTAHQ